MKSEWQAYLLVGLIVAVPVMGYVWLAGIDMSCVLATLLVVALFFFVMKVQDETQTERIRTSSVKQLEDRLVELYNIYFQEQPKANVSKRAANKAYDANCESVKIVVELNKRTGKNYKSAIRLYSEEQVAGIQAGTIDITTPSKKDASVVKRAIVGGVIAGPAGAVVGAISAADKNNKK